MTGDKALRSPGPIVHYHMDMSPPRDVPEPRTEKRRRLSQRDWRSVPANYFQSRTDRALQDQE